MELGLAGVFSGDPVVRAGASAMAAALLPLEAAERIRVERSGTLELHCRIAPWCPGSVFEESGGEGAMIVLGRPWQGDRVLSAAELWDEWSAAGEAVIGRLGGSFAVLRWEPHARALSVATDRLATKKIYVWQSARGVVLATELRALIAHPAAPREVDEGAVEQFLITSHLVDTRSLIRGVSVLPPATITRISASGVASSRYWRPRIAPAEDLGIDGWADRLAEPLSRAVHAVCGASAPLLPLSGGLDSRCVAAFIPTGLAPATHAYTFGYPACYDVRLGRRVARALGASFHRLAIPERFFRQYLDDVQALCDGEVSIEATPMYRLLEVGEPGSSVITGFLGDALSGGHLLDIPPSMTQANARQLIWEKRYQSKGFPEDMLRRVLIPERYNQVQGRTRALMESALDEADAETLDERALLVELHHRQSRYISYFGRLLSYRHVVESPFLHLDVMDAFLALPLRYRKGQRAYRRMLLRAAPHLAAIPEDKTLRPIGLADRQVAARSVERTPTSRMPDAVRWRLRRAERALGVSLSRITGGWLGKRDRGSYVDHADSIRRIDPDWFRRRLLCPQAAEWFQVPVLQSLLDDHMARKHDHSIRLNNVIAFLNWLEATKR